MIESIVAYSIRNRMTVGMLVLFIIGWGLYAVSQLPIDAVPDITNNQVQVVTTSTSLAPQEVEKFITHPIELVLRNLPDVVEMRSISRYGLSIVTIVFQDKMPILHARQLVQEQLNMVNIPESLGLPELMPITTGLGEIYQYTIEVDKGFEDRYSLMELREIQDWIVKRRLSGIPGIIEVGSYGGLLKQYEVAVDPDRLMLFDLSLGQVVESLASNNQNAGGAYIEKGDLAIYIRSEGLIQSTDEIEEILVEERNGTPIRIKDVGEVRFGHATRYGAMTKNGQGEAVGGIAYMLKGANSLETVRRVKERVEEVNKIMPPGTRIEHYLDRSDLIERAITTVRNNLTEGALIVIFVLIFFLGNYRAGLIAASVIPLSLLFSLGMMDLTGVSANLMSLGAIDFGIIIDCAVIVVESAVYTLTVKYRGQILNRAQMEDVIAKSSFEVIKPAFFGVLVILVVFFPIMTLTGIEGKMFKPMAQTLSYALIGALILSLTYVPMLTAWAMKREVNDKNYTHKESLPGLKRALNAFFSHAFAHSWKYVAFAVLLFAFSLFGFSRLGGEFLPNLEEGDLAMQITISPGSSLSKSVEVSTKAEQILLDEFPEVKAVVSKIGTAEVPTDPMAMEEADVMILLKDKAEWVSADNRDDLANLMKEKLEAIPGVEFDFTQPIQLRFNELMTGVKTDLAIKIFGDDPSILLAKAEEIAHLTADVRGAEDIKIEQVEGMNQIRVIPDREALSRYGLSIRELNDIIQGAFAGAVAGTVYKGERRFDLVVRYGPYDRENFDLNSIRIKTSGGQTIPLSQVASLIRDDGPLQISREEGRRRVTIGINVRNRDIASVVEEINKILDRELLLPSGYFITYGGQFENLQSAKERLKVVVPISLFAIFMLLYFALKKVKHALTIMSVVPMTVIGGVAALYLRDLPFSISAGVGFIALFGIAVLNGLVLVSYMVDPKSNEGLSLEQTIVNAVKVRLRPVLMTAATDVLGFLPMALSQTAGAEVQRPLATVVIGGVISSTLLTIFILPLLYYLVEGSFKFGSNMKKLSALSVVLLMIVLPSHAFQDNKSISMETLEAKMLEQHPVVRHYEEALKASRSREKEGFRFDQTEFSYQYGQINSEDRDPFFSIRQNFGSIPEMVKRGRLLKEETEFLSQNQDLLLLQFRVDFRKTYLLWVYHHTLQDVLEREYNAINQFAEVANKRLAAGETSGVEVMLAANQLDKLSREKELNKAEIESIAAALRAFVNENLQSYKPDDSFSELLEKLKVNMAGGSVENHPELMIELRRLRLFESQQSVERAALFPSVFAGYFNQRITDFNIRESGLKGYEVGMSIPLFFRPYKARIDALSYTQNAQQEKISAERMRLIAERQRIVTKIEGLVAAISKFESAILPNGRRLEELSRGQYLGGSSTYLEYHQIRSIVYQDEKMYLQQLRELAFQLCDLSFFNAN